MSLRMRNTALRQQRILNAARAIIVLDGVGALSMRRLADKAQVAVRTLYNVYGSRAAILEALVEQAAERMDQALDKAAGLAADPLARCHAVMAVSVEHILRSETLARALVLAQQQGTDDSSGADARLVGRVVQLEAIAIRAATEQGMLTAALDPDLLAEQVYQTYRSAYVQWACRRISGAELLARALYGLYLTLLGAATPAARDLLEAQLLAAQDQLRAARRQPYIDSVKMVR